MKQEKKERIALKETLILILIVLSYSVQPVEKEGHPCCSYLKFSFLTCNKYDFISACSLTNLMLISKIEENWKTKEEC